MLEVPIAYVLLICSGVFFTYTHWALYVEQRDGLTFLFASFLLLGPVVKCKTKLTIWALFTRMHASSWWVVRFIHDSFPFLSYSVLLFHPLVPCGSMPPDTHLPRIVLACTAPGLCVPILPAGHIPSLTYWVSLGQPENPDLSSLLYASFKVPGLWTLSLTFCGPLR